MNRVRLLPPPGVPIGYFRDGRPIYPVIGAASDEFEVEADEPDDAEEEEEDAEPEDDDKGGKSGLPTKAEWLKVQTALSKANASAKERRLALAERDRMIAELQKEKADREAEAERKALIGDQTPAAKGKKGRGGVPASAPTLPDSVMTKAQVRQLTAQAAKEAEERTAAKFQDKVVKSAARAALKDAGAAGNVSRLVGLLDLEEVQVDDDGEVSEGLEEQIEQLKAELPQLFTPAEPPKPVRRRAPAPKVTPAGRQEAQERPLSSADKIAAQALGNRV